MSGKERNHETLDLILNDFIMLFEHAAELLVRHPHVVFTIDSGERKFEHILYFALGMDPGSVFEGHPFCPYLAVELIHIIWKFSPISVVQIESFEALQDGELSQKIGRASSRESVSVW